MSTESYADIVREQLGQRRAKLAAVTSIVHRIINRHTLFDDTILGSPLRVLSLRWKEDRPRERVWLDLLDREGAPIGPSRIADMSDRAAVVGSALLQFTDGMNGGTLLTVQMDPSNILGFDTAPLGVSEIGSAIVDLYQYEAALNLRQAQSVQPS
jgi:hypothetical protein